ncbi:hypothetical protein F4677DRAFT_244119 [Hypoxylon crocopeplum]|nr:hypothetical protein F4677DRAFT_244119 [Hypoxylon crocopeplum]
MELSNSTFSSATTITACRCYSFHHPQLQACQGLTVVQVLIHGSLPLLPYSEPLSLAFHSGTTYTKTFLPGTVIRDSHLQLTKQGQNHSFISETCSRPCAEEIDREYCNHSSSSIYQFYARTSLTHPCLLFSLHSIDHSHTYPIQLKIRPLLLTILLSIIPIYPLWWSTNLQRRAIPTLTMPRVTPNHYPPPPDSTSVNNPNLRRRLSPPSNTGLWIDSS